MIENKFRKIWKVKIGAFFISLPSLQKPKETIERIERNLIPHSSCFALLIIENVITYIQIQKSIILTC